LADESIGACALILVLGLERGLSLCSMFFCQNLWRIPRQRPKAKVSGKCWGGGGGGGGGVLEKKNWGGLFDEKKLFFVFVYNFPFCPYLWVPFGAPLV